MIRMEDDFLIRQIMGFRPQSGSIVVAAGGLKEGSCFRFHVRAAKSAREDMNLMIQRAKTERLFAGSSSLTKKGSGSPSATVGRPLAAFQFSCVARGSSFYGAPDVDLKKVEELFDDKDYGSPIAGFFANGEIGPVGIRSAEMAAKDQEQSDKTCSHTFLHGFTTVVAMLCDYSETSTSSTRNELSACSIIMNDSGDTWA
jgi:small ligand-binding sensory domain FIST